MLLTTNLKGVQALHTIDEDHRNACNFTSIQDSCPQSDRNISTDDLHQEAMEVSHCMNKLTHTQTDRKEVNALGSLKCLIRNIKRSMEHHKKEFMKLNEMFLNAEFEISNHSQKTVQQIKCFYCVVSELNYIFSSYNSLNTLNFETFRRMFTLFVYVEISQNVSSVKDNSFFDTEAWEDVFNILTNYTLDTNEIRKDVERIVKDKAEEKREEQRRVKNCGFGSECRFRPVLWILYVTAIAGNGLLIFIFIRHREMRSDRNIIILNLAVADILSVLCNASLQVLFISGKTFEEVKIYYRIIDLSLEVSTGVCIYSIVVLSVQRYSAVVPTHKCSKCGLATRFNSNLFVCVLWVAGCMPQIIHVTSGMSFRVWAMRNLILYCVVPVLAMATFYFLTSWRLRQSVRKMPGEAIRQETVRHARVRSSNVLIALIAVFFISYTPIQLFRFIELWFYGGGYLFEYVDLIAYSMLSLNSCFNPVALYVASGSFRRYFNKYLYYRWKNHDLSLHSSNVNVQSKNKSCVFHI
jgi:hypothetical protein